MYTLQVKPQDPAYPSKEIAMHHTALALGLAFTLSTGAAPQPGGPEPVAIIHYQLNEKLVYLPVRVNGSGPLWFTVDSGARHCVIDAAVARRLKLSIVSNDRTTGVGKGSIEMLHAAPSTVAVGAAKLHVADPWVIDLSTTGGRHLDGLIGEDFFAAYVVRIDPLRQTIAFYDPRTYRYAGSGSAIELSAIDQRLFIPMRLALSKNNSAIHKVRIDTGSNDAVGDVLVRQSSERRMARQGVGLGSSYLDYSGVFQSVQIGKYVITHSWGPADPQATVGMEILRRFTMIFDVPHGRLYLEPNAHLHDPVPAP